MLLGRRIATLLSRRSADTRTLLRCSKRYGSTKVSDPLRILFCGSDDFSIASLKAVRQYQEESDGAVASIDVVCRPGKPTGRGLKRIREVPIKAAAQQLSLPVHEIDTFTGWNPPTPDNEPINLIIAVSFGLLVPPRILNGAKYGGVNVHPSLLPDLRGPAPIHHALLKRRTHTGVSVQTLHPKHFDQGLILAQTPRPGIDITSPNLTPDALTTQLAAEGASLLVDCLRRKLYVPPLEGRSAVVSEAEQERVSEWLKANKKQEGGMLNAAPASMPEDIRVISQLSHAPKITPRDKEIQWHDWTMGDILLRSRVIGDLWSTRCMELLQPMSGSTEPTERPRRIIFHAWKGVENDSADFTEELRVEEAHSRREPGQPISITTTSGEPTISIATRDGQLLEPTSFTIEGEKKGGGKGTLLKLLKAKQTEKGI